jgi:hypothetical protein
MQYLSTSSALSDLTWIVLGLLAWLTLAVTFHLLSIKDGYHGTHRTGTLVLVRQSNGLYDYERPRASWDFGDSPTISFYRGGRVPEWGGSSCYVA